MQIPVIDLFAGPGGLGEGFSAFEYEDGHPFKIHLSIEKDHWAHQTLQLRSFYRQFQNKEIPEAYYEYLRDIERPEDIRRQILFDKCPDEAKRACSEAHLAELGKQKPEIIHNWIESSLEETADWVLIGGPPCQAYSLMGRSRNKAIADYVPEEDERQYLYVEYLQILADHRPAVFVMENVKGLLSATLRNKHVFERMYKDLQEPRKALRREGRKICRNKKRLPTRYRLFSLIKSGDSSSLSLSDFVVAMEYFGVPQARHRVIIIGIREDLADSPPRALKPESTINTEKVLSGLPDLRSGLSKEPDCPKVWRDRIYEKSWIQAINKNGHGEVYEKMMEEMKKIHPDDRGAEFIPCEASINHQREWYLDGRMGGVCNHATRGHIVSDIHRYFFAACFASIRGRSPILRDFPEGLLPNHSNVKEARKGSTLFADRFRVQLKNKPATTITSHISKDGHYYIHYDPLQCRSLTVREAARLQTFPDNYFFCGPRTRQYIQVGNAVPPLLAKSIASIVFDLMSRAVPDFKMS